MKSSSSGTLLWAALHRRSSVFESEIESTSMALGNSQVDPQASHRVYPKHRINATMVETEVLTFILVFTTARCSNYSVSPAVTLTREIGAESSDPFALKYPESVDATLSSQAVCVNFNPTGPYAGQYLAAGDCDGLVEVWNAESKGLVRVLEGHVKAVSSVQ
jgi:WD40 repeat protein